MKSKKMYKRELLRRQQKGSRFTTHEIQKAKSFVDILLSSEENHSVDNIIKINSKQKIAEENCLRKINFFNPDQCKNTIYFSSFSYFKFSFFPFFLCNFSYFSYVF